MRSEEAMRQLVRLSLVLALCSLAGTAMGFVATWTDQFGETTYSITGPEAAFVGDTVLVAISAADPYYPNDMVASSWSFMVDAVQQDGGFAIYLTEGSWERSYRFVYDSEGIHTYLFRAQDLGHGGGAHNWQWFEIGGTTSILLPTGACCFQDGTCQILNQPDCVGQGGSYQGDGTTCEPNPCPQPPMACCFEDCHCEYLTAEVCSQIGGDPMGYGSVCDPNPCPCGPPYGACCIGDQGRCEWVTEEDCAAMGGVYQGDNVPCDPPPCVIDAGRSVTWGQIKAAYR